MRKSALHDRLGNAGACFGEAFGWERANWYAPAGATPRYEYSYGRQNWFEHSAREHRAVLQRRRHFQSVFPSPNVRLEGADAARVLNRVCANDVAVAPGKIIYTQWLNDRGGIEADLTVTRLSDAAYLIVGGAETESKDFNWLQRHIPAGAHCVLTNVTSGLGVLSVMGPRSRELLRSLTPDDMSDAGSIRHAAALIEHLGLPWCALARITYVGELGWELYIPTEFLQGVYDELIAAGVGYGLVHAGYHALNSLRIEKETAPALGPRHISAEDSPLVAGFGFAVKWDKPDGFVGLEALLRQKQTGCLKRLVQFKLESPEPLLYHNEPIWRGGSLVGHIRSGMYGHSLGAAVGLGYVRSPDGTAVDSIAALDYEIEVAGVRYPASASLRPMYDPQNRRIKL